tara:strand:- start:862 stop:1476 length:615 start_codon:yes stop_codon:yes gene_type:complete
MKLSGSYKLKLNKESVWKALNDPDILKQCIPGCESFDKKDETHFNVTATNQIGPMNATFTGDVSLTNIKENESYTLSGEGHSSVGFANGTAEVKLAEVNGETTLTYDVNINVGGKIAQLGSRLINGVAKKMSDYFFGRFADIIAPITKNVEFENTTSVEGTTNIKVVAEKRVKELKSNFLNRYIYSIITILILLLVAIFYFVSR